MFVSYGANYSDSFSSLFPFFQANGYAKVDLKFRLRAEYRKKIFGKWKNDVPKYQVDRAPKNLFDKIKQKIKDIL